MISKKYYIATLLLALLLACTVEPPPTLLVSHVNLAFTAQHGGPNPATQQVTVTNGGGGTLNWSAVSNQGWLLVSPTSGNLGEGHNLNVAISVNTAGLTVGSHRGIVTFMGAGAPQTVIVYLSVTAPPPTIPAVGEPRHYVGGRLTLRQDASMAYFVALNNLLTEATGSYSLAAEGAPAGAAQSTHRPVEDHHPNFHGEEWRILEEGKRVATLLPIIPRPWTVPVYPKSVGTQRHFWVCLNLSCRWADGEQAQITATLQAIGPRSRIYVDNRDLATIPIHRAEGIRNVFDGEIWPRMTPVFGKPVNPYNPTGGEPTIILFSRSVAEMGWGGYFHPIHLFRDSDAQRWGLRSNEASMFFLSHNMSDRWIHALNAHEFQHLINFSQKWFVHGATTSESTWIDEGLSEVAKDIAGHGFQTGTVQGLARIFFENAELVSLHNWGSVVAPIWAYYGGAWLIFRYIADRFGNAALTRLVQSPFVGAPNIERVTGEPIGRTFLYSAIAMVVSTESLNVIDPRWTYRSLSLEPIGRISFGGVGARTVPSLGFNFVRVSSGGQPAVRATITAGSITPYVGLVR